LRKFFRHKIICSAGFSLTLLCLLLSCSSEEKIAAADVDEPVLVKINETSISVDEFLRRAEYTIRPSFARQNTMIHQKVVLNSLVAEKLMALEEKKGSALDTSQSFQAYIRGRKEQAMRQWLYAKEIHDSVKVDENVIKNVFAHAGRKYNIAYVSLPDVAHAFAAADKLFLEKMPFENLFSETGDLSQLPQREVAWGWGEHPIVLDSLFAQPVQKNQVLGPLEISDEHYVFVKVLDWVDAPAITEQQAQTRLKNVRDHYKSRGAVKRYESYIRKMMRGKTVTFNRDGLKPLASLLAPFYLKTDKEKQETMKRMVWQIEDSLYLEQLDASTFEPFDNVPLLRLNDEVWTIKDFRQEVMSHPLVFRQKKMKPEEFGQQLQFAIMDLIRDKFLTERAYKSGYDKQPSVVRNENMWKDNAYAIYHRQQFLHSIGITDSMFAHNTNGIIEEALNPYIDGLFQKYSTEIQVDTEAFNTIKLTRIDLVAIQQDVPYPLLVPGFPYLTSKNRLDYGVKLQRTAANKNLNKNDRMANGLSSGS